MNADDVKKALDAGSKILRERERPPEKRSSQIRLSNAGACVRRLYLLDSGEAPAEELSAETLRIFDTGTARGIGMAEALIARLGEGWETRAEQTVTLEIAGVMVPGHVDLLACRRDGGEALLFEMKTANPFAWKRIDEDDPSTISEQYVAQVGCYAEAALGGLELPTTFFVSEDKATSQHKILEVPEPLLRAGAEAGKANLGAAIRALREKKRPERPYGPNAKGELPWNCGYCGVWKTCWEGQAEEVPGKPKKLRMVKR